MKDYVKNEIYAKHLARNERNLYSNFGKDKQGVYERFYTRKLIELSVNRFQWKNLPLSIDKRYLEMTLLDNALAVFFQSEFAATEENPDGALMALSATPSGQQNATNNPVRFQLSATNYPKISLSAKECVPIWANISRISDRDLINIYAHRLATLDVTLDINSMNARRAKVAFADENQRLSVANAVRQIDEGAPAIYTNTPMEQMGINVFDFGVDPKNIETLHVYRVRLWNECMMFLGIQGANQDKKERLVAAEVDANSEQIDLNEYNALTTRKMAVEQINRKFGTDISVDFIVQETAFSALDGQ